MWVLVSSRCLRVFSLVNATLSCSFLFSCCSMNTLTFNLSVDVHVGPSPSSTSVFPRFNPTTIFKTSPGTLIFLGWPLNLFSKCAVICCWPPSIFLFLFLFVFFLPKLWQNVTHPLANFPAPFEKETERGRGSGGHWGESLEIWDESGCRSRSVTHESHISAGLPSGTAYIHVQNHRTDYSLAFKPKNDCSVCLEWI